MPSGLLTRPQLAQAFGVIPGTITRWEADGMPVARRFSRGKSTLFDLEAVKAWRERVDAAGSTSAASLSASRAKVADATFERMQLELAARRGELVSRDQVIREGRAQVKGWTAMIRTLPRRAAQEGIIAPSQIAGLEKLCRDLLTEISRWRTVGDVLEAAAAAEKGTAA